MSHGKLIDGKFESTPSETNNENELRANLGKSFFAYSIPSLWRVSATYAFVMDSGYGCDADKDLGEYLDDATMEATGACINSKQYYLVNPSGDSTTGTASACAPTASSHRLQDWIL